MTTYELFGDETTFEVLSAFQLLYNVANEQGLGKLTDLQKEILSGVASGLSYSKLQEQLDKKHIASIQAGIRGGIKNILDAVMDTVWIFNNPQLLEWLNENVEKRFGDDNE